jgi:hypothetical protein
MDSISQDAFLSAEQNFHFSGRKQASDVEYDIVLQVSTHAELLREVP